MSDYESVRIVPGGTRWSCDRCVVDRDGNLIASYLTEEDSGVGDPILAKKMTGHIFKTNRKVPYKPMKVPASWYNFPGEKK